MCNNNLLNIFTLDFSQTNDEVNWFSNSINPITTVNNQLLINPDSISNVFARNIGVIDVAKNRINIKLNLDIFRPSTGGSNITELLIQILNGSNVIGQNTVHIENLSTSELVKYFFDRTYKYDNISGNISVKIKSLQGLGNEVRLTNLSVDNYFFCQENVRTYFVIDEFLEKSFSSQSSGFKMNSFKVDNLETLTPDFFAYHNVNIGGSTSNWNYSKANLDGTSRVTNNLNPNSFNPFVNELGLVFDTINSFHGGKPIATITGQDFGNGLMSLGFEKPTIINGVLQEKKGCFFIDIDFTKNLFLEFEVLVNDNNLSTFQFPTIYRKYYLIWDKDTCIKQFYYIDQLTKTPTIIDQLINGFLYGITPEERIGNESIPCNQTLNYTGESGSFEYLVDFGLDTGVCGINYNAYGVPDRFEILWDNIQIDSGYVGLSSYNQQLLNAGVPANIINTTASGNGSGILTFNKTSPTPTTALIRVSGLLQGTGWTFSGICPVEINEAIIKWDDTKTDEPRSNISNSNQLISLFLDNISLSNDSLLSAKWQKETGLGWVDIINYTINPQDVTAYSGYLNRYRIQALGVNGTVINSNVLELEIQGIDTGGGGTGGGCPTLDMLINISKDKFKKVSELNIADLIYTKHEKTKEVGFYYISSLTKSKQKIVRLLLENNVIIEVSDSHKFETPTGEYVGVLSFNVNDKLTYNDSFIKIILITHLKEEKEVMHIEVAEAHTYMINGVNSHNKLLPPDENDPIIP